MIAVWRGGTPIGVAVQEVLQFHGVNTDHIAIRTSSYSGIDEQSVRSRYMGLIIWSKTLPRKIDCWL